MEWSEQQRAWVVVATHAELVEVLDPATKPGRREEIAAVVLERYRRKQSESEVK